MTSRTIDPAEALTLLRGHQPNFDKMQAAEILQQNRDLDEIAMLERRVNTLYEDVDLGNGDTIRVRTALSEEESVEYNTLQQRLADATEEEKSEITYRQLEIMTANPLLTAEWFRDNQDKWPVNDALAVASGFLENQLQVRKDRVANLQRFRNQ